MTDQWLVRTSKNFIAGPYSKAQVIQLIREGQLTLEDEVCQANHYWIFLHEHEEVSKQLGIEVPRAAKGDEEVTETQTETLSTDVASEIPDLGPEMESEHTTAIVRGGGSRGHASQTQHPPQAHLHPGAPAAVSASGGGVSHVAHHAGASAAGAQASHEHSSAMHRPVTLYPPAPSERHAGTSPLMEKLAIWRTFAWLLIVVACVIVFIVLRVLHSQR